MNREFDHESVKNLLRGFDFEGCKLVKNCELTSKDSEQFELTHLEDLQNFGLQNDPFESASSNYISFCPQCLQVYEVQTDFCDKCKGTTITQPQSLDEFLERVKAFKEEDQSEYVKEGLNLYEKTQQILLKNQLKDQQWDFLNDHNLDDDDQYLDMSDNSIQYERQQTREEANMTAEKLKLKGNEFMKVGQYEQAVEKYTQALELVKDVKAIWLNRALAYLKLENYKKCIRDCTMVIQCCEKYEDGFTFSRESCFKAFLRRGKAQKERGEFFQALQDAEQANLLIPNDFEAQQLKRDVEQLIDKDNRGQKTCYKEVINQFVVKYPSQIKNRDFMALLKSMRRQPDEAKAYFNMKDGINKVLEVIEYRDDIIFLENLTAHLPPMVIQLYLDNDSFYKENFYSIGIGTIVRKIEKLLSQNSSTQHKSSLYDLVEDYLDIIDAIVEEEKTRLLMQGDEIIADSIYPSMWNHLIPNYEQEPIVIATFISLCSNICYGPSKLKQKFEANYLEVVKILEPILLIQPKKQEYLQLLTSVCNLLSNFLSETSFRSSLVKEKEIFKRLTVQLNCVELVDNVRIIKWVESAEAVFVNLSYQAKEETLDKLLSELRLGDLLINRFIYPKYKTITSRALQILSKLSYSNGNHSLLWALSSYIEMDLKEKKNNFTSHVIRLIMQIFTTANSQTKEQLRLELQSKPLVRDFNENQQLCSLLSNLRQLLFQDAEQIFCNTCNAIGYIIEISPLSPDFGGQNPCSFFHQVIPRLLTITRDKSGNFKKNSAILLAKLTKEEKNLQSLRDLHGIEILHNAYSAMQK